jgi:regulator of sirC expression with transglutaminase-like and TPR domain
MVSGELMVMGELGHLVGQSRSTVEEGALLIAKDAYPGLDVARYLRLLDELAAPLARRTAGMKNPYAEAGAIGEYLFGELGFRGNEEAYYDARNSYLNDVLDRRTGIPLTLGIVILALARRCGITADGIQFPGHFLIRLGGATGCYVDPFLGARVLSTLDLEILVKRAIGRDATVKPQHLAVADTRTMLIRALNNLRAIFEKQGEHARGMLVCDRLVDLGAGPDALRDRGFFALREGAYEAARADLGAYLKAMPKAGDRSAVERAIAEASNRTNLN